MMFFYARLSSLPRQVPIECSLRTPPGRHTFDVCIVYAARLYCSSQSAEVDIRLRQATGKTGRPMLQES